MSIIECLRNTPKGELTYANKELDISKLQDDLDQLSPPPLSRSHQEKESSLLNLSFGLNTSDFDSDTKLNYNDNAHVTQGENQDEPKEFAVTVSIAQALRDLEDGIEKSDPSKEDGPNESYASPNVSPQKANHSLNKDASHSPRSPNFSFSTPPSAVWDEEQLWESSAQLSVYRQTSKFDDHARALDFLMKQKSEEMNNKIQRLSGARQNMMEQRKRESLAELQKSVQRLKEDHEQHQKKIVNKRQEMERQREKLEEEHQKRQEHEMQKMNLLRSLLGDIEANRQKFNQLQENCNPETSSIELIDKFKAVLDKVCSNLNVQLTAVQNGGFVPDELVTKFQEDREKSNYTVELLKKQIEIAKEKAKEEEARQKDLELKKAEEKKKKEESDKLVQEAAQDLGVQSLAHVLKEHESKARVLSEVEANIAGFVSNTEMKKYRFDLQRAVNTPINAISPISGAHLRDKLQSLHFLLSGQTVEVAGNRRVSAKTVPQGTLFCQNLVAKMLVKKGEEQVTSNHESAFAIGAVVVGVWAEFPTVGELFLAHLQALCPYVLPFYSPSMEGQSTENYHKTRGYKINEAGTIEEQDKFLHRMSGLMRLYCACMVATPPKAGSPHPHSIQYAWMWLARTLNMEPQADITAAMIFDLLSVTGHFLWQAYRIQFVKLVYMLYKEYLPKMKAVSVTSSIVGRLEILLETSLKNGARMEMPKGLLSSNFWYS